MESKVLIVLGMGRSGTSFVAGYVDKCGIKMGIDFLEPNWMNPKGYFEDIGMLTFQDSITKRTVKNVFKVNLTDDFKINENDMKVARQLISTRNEKFNQWGWKDCRTNLLVNDIWNELLPDAKYILMFRNYLDVVDSLMRSNVNAQKFRRNKMMGVLNKLIYKLPLNKKAYANTFLRAWIRHNRDAITHLKNNKNKEDFLVLSVENLLLNPSHIYSSLCNMGFNIPYFDPNLNYYNEEFVTGTNRDKYNLDKNLLIEAENLYQELLTFL